MPKSNNQTAMFVIRVPAILLSESSTSCMEAIIEIFKIKAFCAGYVSRVQLNCIFWFTNISIFLPIACPTWYRHCIGVRAVEDDTIIILSIESSPGNVSAIKKFVYNSDSEKNTPLTLSVCIKPFKSNDAEIIFYSS